MSEAEAQTRVEGTLAGWFWCLRGVALRPGLQGMEKLQIGSDVVPTRSCLCWGEKHCWQDIHRNGKYTQAHRKNVLSPSSSLVCPSGTPIARVQRRAAGQEETSAESQPQLHKLSL